MPYVGVMSCIVLSHIWQFYGLEVGILGTEGTKSRGKNCSSSFDWKTYNSWISLGLLTNNNNDNAVYWQECKTKSGSGDLILPPVHLHPKNSISKLFLDVHFFYIKVV